MDRRGFTIVELLIVLVVIGTLLIMGVVNLREAQANSRDTERRSDVETIASYLDTYYKTGYNYGTTTAGAYPSTYLTDPIGSGGGGVEYIKAVLVDVRESSLEAPSMINIIDTFVSATNNDQSTTGVTPQPTINQYVYQPIDKNGSLCMGTTECRSFNIFWRSEVDNSVYKVISKNQ
ncbi:type II secretion system protein [Candidatus Saccharibacteria bacterium]|nr:type II secretion system protein [Candidatus Saccharibacteria bacterium]